LHGVAAVLSADGISVEILRTTGPGTATELARQAVDSGADLILAAGGDGTINEVVNGMVHSKVPLGILPGGTANVLATELALGSTPERAAKALRQCVPARVALGLLTLESDVPPRHFLLMAGAGLDAEIVFGLDLKLKSALGKAAYWIGGFRKLGRRLQLLTVEAEGRSFDVSFALASRVRNYGGDLEIARTVSLLDDHFELVLFEGASSVTFLKYLLAVALKQHHRMRGITLLRTQSASFLPATDAGIHVQIDGEYAGLAPARVDIVPNALTLLVPPTLRTRRPISIVETEWTTLPTR
jgi:diacylglycerol kinase (ATP)